MDQSDLRNDSRLAASKSAASDGQSVDENARQPASSAAVEDPKRYALDIDPDEMVRLGKLQ